MRAVVHAVDGEAGGSRGHGLSAVYADDAGEGGLDAGGRADDRAVPDPGGDDAGRVCGERVVFARRLSAGYVAFHGIERGGVPVVFCDRGDCVPGVGAVE
ncbi:hypothetical protein D1872_259430 [compost metagenome]